MEMPELLRRLNRQPGVRGSLVLTSDGIPVHCEIPAPLDIETVAAGVGSCVRSLAGERRYSRIVVTPSVGRLALIDASDSWVVVLLDESTQIELASLMRLLRGGDDDRALT